MLISSLQRRILMGVVNINQVFEGDIVQFSNKASAGLYQPPGGTRTFGFVAKRNDVNDRLDHFDIYEVVPINEHSRAKLVDGAKFQKLDLDTSVVAGLDSSKEWAVLIEPRRLYPTRENLDQTVEGKIEKRGNINNLGVRRDLLSRIEQMGGVDAVRRQGSDFIGMSSSDSTGFGMFRVAQLYVPGDTDVVSDGPKRLKKAGVTQSKRHGTMGATEGKVIDLPLKFAHAALGLDEQLIEAVMNPHSSDLKPLTTLRQLKDVEDIKPYLERNDDFIFSGTLVQARNAGLLPDDTVRNALSEVWEESDVKPIKRFKEAYITGQQDPDIILQEFVETDVDDEDLQDKIITQLEQGHEKHVDQLANNYKSLVKSAWSDFAEDYLKLRKDEPIENPERYMNLGEDAEIPLVRSKKGRSATSMTIESGQSAAIMLPNVLYPKM